MASRKVQAVLSMIKRLTVQEMADLAKKLQEDPNWPGTATSPVRNEEWIEPDGTWNMDSPPEDMTGVVIKLPQRGGKGK